LLVGIITSSLCVAPISISQSTIVSPIQTGFVVVTPIQGNGQGISVSETFGQRVDGSLFQSSVLSSPTVTLTDVLVNVDPTTVTDTGIAIVNPNNGTATVTLSLTNQNGTTLDTRTITIGGLQQISRFATELFQGVPELASPFSGLMFISSDVAVSVMGLTFVGPSFTSLPVAAQLTPSNTMNAAISTTTGTAISMATTNAVTTAAAVNTANSAGVVLPSTITQIPSTVLGPPNTFVGLAPSQSITTVTTPVSTTTPVQATTITPAAVAVTTTPTVVATTVTSTQTTASVIVNGALLLPQIATGGGWVSQISIANTSNSTQVVRVDIFNSSGGRLVVPFSSNLSNVVIPPGGVVTFSTAG
jgi:hypothetical protein